MATQRSDNVLTQWVFMRSLALVYLLAIGSLWLQIDGLIGAEGILPWTDFLELVTQKVPQDDAALIQERWYRYPTLAWWMPRDDSTLTMLCGAGAGFALCLLAGLLEGWMLLGMWAIYLSLSTICQVWLGYQWDILLVETCFVAMLWARWRPYPYHPIEPSMSGLWATRWLVFRLMLTAGVVKLASGDETWSGLTALTYHYWTQPLPNPFSWVFHQAPLWFHQGSVIATLAIELVLPWLIFAGFRGRQLAFSGMFLLMCMLAITGNYGFFQLLSIVLLFSLLDDEFWSKALPARLQDRIVREGPIEIARFGEIALGGVALLLWVLSMLVLSGQAARYAPQSGAVGIGADVVALARPWRTVNPYGLFSTMTTERREIRIEGSRDGKEWAAYRFAYKPGDPGAIPPQVAPHMPRLEWQLWFAALQPSGPDNKFLGCKRNPFLGRTMRKLLQGSPAVEGLFATDPFGAEPPRQIRAMWADYRFTTRGEEGWWTVEELGPYCPILKR